MVGGGLMGGGVEPSVVPPNPSQPPCEREDIERKWNDRYFIPNLAKHIRNKVRSRNSDFGECAAPSELMFHIAPMELSTSVGRAHG